MINALENQFRYYLKNYGVSIVVDGTETTGFLKEIENTTGNDTKYLFVDIGLVKQGSIVNALNEKWLVISKETNFNDVYDKAIVRKIQFEINFIINDTLTTIPAIVDTKTMDTDTGQYLTLVDGKIIVTIPAGYDININDRFIKMGSAWKVVGIDKSINGLVSLYAEKDLFANGDDIENEIPAGLSKWTIEIVEKDITKVQQNNTVDFSAKVYKDRVEQQGINVTWETSDNSITTVDENGVVTALALGQVNIVAKITDMPNIFDTHTITVVEEQQETVTYELDGVDTIFWGGTEEYNAVKKINGSPVDANFTFEVFDGGNSDYYVLTVVDNDTCTIKHNTKGYTNITLRATDNETGEYVEKDILIKNIF